MIGYASLAVVGLLGTTVFHLVVGYALFALRAADPIRTHTIARRFAPDVVVEGDVVVEEVRLEGTRVPLGFRLFLEGRVAARWPTTRHVVTSDDSGGEVQLETEVGPAVRGVHAAEPLRAWLEDVFGLTRSPAHACGLGAPLTVLPRVPKASDSVKRLLTRGDGPRAPKQAMRLPTEGLFHLREYKQGDDVRRIHWVRSLASRELIVRMPDEIPPDRPRVRLVLDTFFPEAFALSCDAPSEMLDALVAVWLGLGRALVAGGTRVTLVTAVDEGDRVVAMTLDLTRGDAMPAQRLGAKIAWQGSLPIEELLAEEPTYVISPRIVDAPPSESVRWVFVAPDLGDVPWGVPDALRFPLPMGATENAWRHRRAAADEVARKRLDHRRALLVLGTSRAAPPPGSLAALALPDGSIHVEAIR